MRILLFPALLGSAAVAAAQAPAANPVQPPPSQMTRVVEPPSAPPTPAQAERDAKIRAALAKADADNNKRWTKPEWLAAGRKAANFDALDTNKDGAVTPAEMRVEAVRLDAERDRKAAADHSNRGEKARDALAKADANGDKQYSKAEWLAAGRQARNFDLLDANKDGVVTAGEIRAAAVAATAARKPVPPAR